MIDFRHSFDQALSYTAFLEQYASDDHRRCWADVHEKIALTGKQYQLLQSFSREMNVLCLAGAWCGDGVSQCSIFDHFAAASDRIQMRFMDRDADESLGQELRLCGAQRVPIVVFLSEDFQECGRYGDRTLSRYRSMAGDLTGAACSTELIDSKTSLNAVIEDWLREFERVQLMLRLSPRLRQKHGD